ncbi:choice-of-anchor L domain-containing protein [Flavobacterium sp.]|uniref:choice-of-anchor L domain-containing protein n=1 Tax=Flavobacterium sp. TaxID=239 RepID=UPI0038FCD40B
MKCLKIFSHFAIICCSYSNALGQITVKDDKSADELVSILTNNSPCIIVSPASVKGDTFTPGKNSYGYFNKSTSGFPFSEGIILNTDSATNAIGPYNSGDSGGGKPSWSGDTDLNSILGISTVNATVLEFDFVPLTNYISFNYIFASNEYQLYFPCYYSDGFAFLIKENISGSTYKNLAVIPNSFTPVSSKNIHPIINDYSDSTGFYKGCPSIAENYFNGYNTNISPINYSGQTKVMKATTSVIANQSYHIKLVIADDRNIRFDSAIFIEAGSFEPKIDLGPDQLLITNNPVCFGDPFVLDTKLSPTYTYKWFKNGDTTPIPGEIYPTLNVTDSGTYSASVDIGSGCIATGEIKIEFAPLIVLNPINEGKCDEDGSGTATFDLTKVETKIKNLDPKISTVTFYETQAGAVLYDPIVNPGSFVKTSVTDQEIYYEVRSIYDCTAVSTITLTTQSSNFIPGIGKPPMVNDFLGNDNSVELIPPSTAGPYEFSLDGINYQASNVFTGLSIGNYTAYIRDTITCEYSIYELTILDYPKFFTPNEDGYNDNWEIKNLDLFPKAIVSIFDRFGKLVAQINTLKNSWDGKLNGIKLPSDDYWFSLNFGDGKIVKGHFTLKR